MIEIPSKYTDAEFTDVAMRAMNRRYVDIGHIQTIGSETKRWTGIEWLPSPRTPLLPGDSLGPTLGDIGTDKFGCKTIFDGRNWLSVRDPNEKREGDHFAVEDNDLCQLLNLAGDLVLGNGNMDTAILFGRILERVEARLNVAN